MDPVTDLHKTDQLENVGGKRNSPIHIQLTQEFLTSQFCMIAAQWTKG